jgi:hypothetical protein
MFWQFWQQVLGVRCNFSCGSRRGEWVRSGRGMWKIQNPHGGFGLYPRRRQTRSGQNAIRSTAFDVERT